jgi:hypothetical protein
MANVDAPFTKKAAELMFAATIGEAKTSVDPLEMVVGPA